MRFSGRLKAQALGRRWHLGHLVPWGLPVALALILACWIGWPAWQAYILQKTVFKEKQELLARYEKRLTRDKPALEKELAKAKSLGQAVFVGLDPYVIVSDLEKDVDQIPQLSLRSFRITKKEDLTPRVQKVRLVLVLEGDIKGLLTFLEDLKDLHKALRVSHLVVIPRRYKGAYILSVTLELEVLYAAKPL